MGQSQRKKKTPTFKGKILICANKGGTHHSRPVFVLKKL
jgi:hypothetical protein